MGAYRNTMVDLGAAEILKLIRGWEGYELFTSEICEALELVADELLAPKALQRFATPPIPDAKSTHDDGSPAAAFTAP